MTTKDIGGGWPLGSKPRFEFLLSKMLILLHKTSFDYLDIPGQIELEEELQEVRIELKKAKDAYMDPETRISVVKI